MKSAVLIFYTCLFVKIALDYGHQGNLWITCAIGFSAFYCAMYAIQNLFLSVKVIQKLVPEVEKAMTKAAQELSDEEGFERDEEGRPLGPCECEKCVAEREKNGDKNSAH